jgi:cysteinyl-tRNA synthetase
MAASERAVARLRQALAVAGGTGTALDADPYRVRVLDAMDDDFSTPQALAALFDLAREINRAADEGRGVDDAQRTLRVLGGDVLGLRFDEREVSVPPELAQRIEELVGKRTALRGERRWADADAIRDELAALDVVLTDSPDGTTWRVEIRA